LHLTEIIPGSLYQCDADLAVCEALRGRGHERLLFIDLCGIDVERIPRDEGVAYVRWPIEDGPVPNRAMLAGLEQLAARMIDAGGTVVAMCSMGLNRSGLMSASILCRVRSMRGREALAFVRSKNSNALRNDAFVQYLEVER
jgi:protein-tyrosine phosphatase